MGNLVFSSSIRGEKKMVMGEMAMALENNSGCHSDQAGKGMNNPVW